ncbi:MAG: hypothetical protein ABI333_03305 [bacterium]
MTRSGRHTHPGGATLAAACCLLLLNATACRDEAVGIGDPTADAAILDGSAPSPDSAVDERCADWQPAPGELQVWNSTSGVGERHAAAAVGRAGIALVVWATDDGVWGRARCASGAPLLEGGLDTRLDDGGASSLSGPYVRALQDGRFVVTWRDDTDASIRAVWLDALGARSGPVVKINTEETAAQGRPPRVVQLADGDLVFFWREVFRSFSVDGEPRDTDWDFFDETFKTLDAAAGANGQLLQLRDGAHNAGTAIVLGLRSYSYTVAGGVEFSLGCIVWPHLFNWGRRGFVLASEPDAGRAAVLWPGNYPYEIWLRWVGADGVTEGDAFALGAGGDDIGVDGWMDLAIDGLGETLAVWRTADAAGEIHTWTEQDEDQVLMLDWGELPHFPRLAGFPDGGFLLLMTPDESHPDEEVLFMTIGR